MLGAHPETVVAPQPGEVILNNRAAIGVVSRPLMAPDSQVSESGNVAVKARLNESARTHVPGEAEFRLPVGSIQVVVERVRHVLVAETIVAEREVIQLGGADRPVFCQADNPTRSRLNLVSVGRRARNRSRNLRRAAATEPPAIAVVVNISAADLVAFVEDVIKLEAIVVNIEDRAASGDVRIVGQQESQSRIGLLVLEHVLRHPAESALGNDVIWIGVTNPRAISKLP